MKSNCYGKYQGAWLELIMGSMFSGKTSALEKIYKQYRICSIECIVINFTGDKRYSDTMLSTHDKTTIPCIFVDTLEDATVEASCYNVILINEGQFFPDLVTWVEKRIREKKTIYVCGLDGDFQQNKFGHMLDLIPKADMYTKLKALCAHCKSGAEAPFTFRLSDSKEQTLIGSDQYIPVCRQCMDSLSSST